MIKFSGFLNIPILRRIVREFESKEYLQEISAIALADVLENFDTEGGNVGKPWKRSEGSKKKGYKTLQPTGAMRNSIQNQVVGNEVWIFGNVIVRSKGGSWDLIEIHDKGLGHQPVRTIYEFSDDAHDNFMDILSERLGGK